jgi:hypothetical protein
MKTNHVLFDPLSAYRVHITSSESSSSIPHRVRTYMPSVHPHITYVRTYVLAVLLGRKGAPGPWTDKHVPSI